AAFGWASDESPARGRFHVVDTVTGEVTPYQHDGLDLASERERGWLQRPERVMFLADALVVFARNIPPEEAQSPRFSAQDMNDPSLPDAHWYALWPDGRSLNLTSGLAGVSGVPVQAGEGHVTVSALDGVYRFLPGGGRERLTPGSATEVRLASPGTFATRSGVARPEFRGEALLTLKVEGRPKVMMLDLQAGREDAAAVSASSGPGAVPVVGARATGTFLIRADEGPATRLLSAGRGTTAEVDRVNTHLEDVQFGTWQSFSYTVSDPGGLLDPQVLESCVLLPPGYSQGRPLPLIVDVYPNIASGCGERGAGISYPDPHSPQLWAGKGFAYVKLAAPRDLIRTPEGPIAGLDEVTAAGVQELVKMGLADPDRLILHGYSQGGVSALYVAATSDLYAAVIAKNGWADLFSHYFGPGGVFSILYPEFLGAESGRYDAVIGTDFGIGRTPFEAPETFYENSPVFLAPRINIPVLLMHSDMDIFSMSQFDEMFGALKRAGRDARYVRYWGEGHGPSSPANIRDMWQRTDAFLAEHDLDP
ncbi:MAG: prolyl oligopeptidase family serine peptidase, partial [Alphaproteobacteria bacterium]|nr:prolyl oligopeptidase family serine peptidase [Alphaproteobacteria bacterium]